MSERLDFEDALVALLLPLVGVGSGKVTTLQKVTKRELEQMIVDALPTAPFALVTYGGKSGVLEEGGSHRFVLRASVVLGAVEFTGAAERLAEVDVLLEAVEDALLLGSAMGNGFGTLELADESFRGTVEGVEIWEQTYQVRCWKG